MTSGIAAHIPILSEAAFKPYDGSPSALVDVIRPQETDNTHEHQPSPEEEYLRGLKAGREEAAAEAAVIEQGLADQHASELAELRASMEADIAERLSYELVDGLSQLEQRLASSLSALLEPLLEDQVSNRVVGAFCQTLQALWDGEQRIEIHGPKQLLKRLDEVLAAKAIKVSCVESDVSELVVLLGDTVIESQLSKWLKMISEAVEGRS
ncbi:hypothetical protein [Roseibium sp.]|uniref:hypothetical protein n=1 Tax=Roseibium sp. TaxID=1936156 RepID=UPI003A985813